ncbi:HNH endonuclease [Candidatus Poriferisodalis sp.]|uniref:HNH endonuclease n=1 Tax=Candidatus Poriferisodalis sp. TaxID=3101277 RepID=UPI003AF9C41E
MSLRKISSGRVEERGFFFRKWLFYTTKTNYFVLNQTAYEEVTAQRKRDGAARIGRDADRVLWWTDSGLYWSDPELKGKDVALLIWDRQRRQDSKLERLRKIRTKSEDITAARRERIPDEVRAIVFERDSGRCQKCGSQDDLEYDHIIPVAKGGGNSVNNIQILCADCNRRKGSSII